MSTALPFAEQNNSQQSLWQECSLFLQNLAARYVLRETRVWKWSSPEVRWPFTEQLHILFFIFEQIKWRQNVLLLTYPWNTYIRSFLYWARAFILRTPRHTGGMRRRARTHRHTRSLTHTSSDEATAEPWNIFIHLCSHGNKWNHIPFTTLFST